MACNLKMYRELLETKSWDLDICKVSNLEPFPGFVPNPAAQRLKLSRNKLYAVNKLSAVMLSALFFVSFSFVTIRGHFSPKSP